MITKGYKQLVDEAEAVIETLSVEAAKNLHGDENVTFVDIRDVREVKREGKSLVRYTRRAACWNSGSTRTARIIATSSRPAINSFCIAQALGGPPWPSKRFRKWVLVRLRISMAGSPPGKKPTARWTRPNKTN